METIEVRTRPITWSFGAQVGAHNYLVYTKVENGVTTQYYFSSHPNHANTSFLAPWGNLIAETGVYRAGTYDWQTSNINSTILISGNNLSAQWNTIVQCANTINNSNLQYQPLGQNSNSAVAQCLVNAGILFDIGGLDAYTNGLWTPSDSDGLFQNQVHPLRVFGLGGGGGFDAQPAGYYGNAGFDAFLTYGGGRWVFVSVQVDDGPASSGWRWVESSYFATRIKPLVIDLDGDGLEMTGMNAGTVFDWNGDGYKQSTAWTSGGDGFLVYDANGNNHVDDGREVALTYYSATAETDLEALAVFDSNANGVIDGGDAAFANMKIWVDANMNGVSDPGELTSLASRGIISIALGGVAADGYVAGNHYGATTSVSLSNGGQLTAFDVGLAASARGSKYLGASGIWNVVETGAQEIGLIYTGSTALSFAIGDEKAFGRDTTAYFTGSGSDYLWMSNPSAHVAKGFAIYTGDGDDSVSMANATAGQIIDVGNGADYVMAGYGNDIISHGSGAGYYLDGGMGGNDMYRVQNNSSGWVFDYGGEDAIVFLDVLRSNVTFTRDDYSLYITSGDGAFSLTVWSFFYDAEAKIEAFVFQDQTLFAADLASVPYAPPIMFGSTETYQMDESFYMAPDPLVDLSHQAMLL